MSVHYALHVYRVRDVVWDRKFHSKVPDLYARVKVGDDKDRSRRTRTIKRNVSPHWDDILTLSSQDASTNLNVQIRHESNWSSDPCVGYVDITLADLMKECASGEAQLNLSPPHGKETSASYVGVIHLRLEVIDAMASVEANVQAAVKDIEQRGIVRSAEAADSTANAITDNLVNQSEQGEMYEALGTLVAKLDVFVGIIDKLSKVHPYLDVTWKVTSALYKGVSKQFQTDKKLIDLVRAMEKAFECANLAQSLPEKSQNLEKTVIDLLKQITECCLFVRQYTSHGFVGRMIGVEHCKKIEDFQKSLTRLIEALNTGTIIHTAFVSARISDKVDNLLLRQALNPIRESVFYRPTCLPGTRVEIQEEINSWLLSETSQNILWLKGVAGSGKSTISTTIAEYFREMSRLGAFLFFERGKSKPSSVIPTIAYALASLDQSVAKAITKVVEQDNDIANASAKMQFEKLLLGPLTAAGADLGPVVFVLDALDECGTPQDRRSLMRLFKNDFPKLPSHIRFLLTSRPERDITEALSTYPSAMHEIELDYTSDASRNDVLSYIRYEMNELVRTNGGLKVPEDWPWDDNMKLLGEAAGGLFILASTSVKLVSSSDNPFRKLKEIVSDSQLPTRYGLNELYSTVLSTSGIDWNDVNSKTRFTQVLSLLLFSKAPFTSEGIDGFLGFLPDEPSHLILSRLQCLLDYAPGGLVRLFHASFSDYLLSPGCKDEPWYIEESSHKSFLASRCFAIMEDKLCFNICDLETSFVCDDEVQGLGNCIANKVSWHLRYSCLYWSQHLCDVPCTPDLLDKLSAFCHRHLLYWFEALSLLNQFSLIAGQALETASTWAICNKEIAPFLKDAARLSRLFFPCITRSVAHIYVSMLPLMKDESIVAAHYSKHMDSVTRIERIGVKAPSIVIKVLQGPEESPVTSLNFSPDGKRIVSGNMNRRVIVWDVESGEAILSLRGHIDDITSVNFSPDGKRIISGSVDRTIRVWDAEKGELILNPLEGHMGRVTSVDFSPDGKRIVSGSWDRTIRIWNAESGELILNPLEGHTEIVSSVKFSPDGKRIVSGSWDRMIRVWDADSGKLIVGPLEGHRDDVTSVNFSPDGKRIISGSVDTTIIVWDAESGELILGPLEGHTDDVTSVNFSPDGKSIISGSVDRTIRAWDAEKGRLILNPLEGLMGRVTSVNFSPDSKRIASGSMDRTIRVWDIENGVFISSPLAVHTDWITSVKFSPDGKRIVSSSNDRRIRVWDSESGELILGPLEKHTDIVSSVNFSPDGKRIVSGSNDRSIIVWDASSGKLILGPLEGHKNFVTAVNFSRDGKHIVSGAGDGTIGIWNAECGELILGPLEGPTDYITSVDFSPDGKCIVVGCGNKYTIWNVESGKLIISPLEGHADYFRSSNSSPDGKRIASSFYGETITVLNAEIGRDMDIVGPLEGHASYITSINFSPDGSRIVSGSRDKTIRVWNVLTHNTYIPGELDTSNEDHKQGNCWTLSKDGWVVGYNLIDMRYSLLLWLPPDLRNTLWHPRNTAVFSCAFSTKLDFSCAALGTDWIKCFRPI